MSEREPTEDSAISRLAQLSHDAAGEPSPAELERGLFKVRARLSSRAPGRSRQRWALAAIALVLSGVLLASGAAWWSQARSPHGPQPVGVSRIEGGQLLQGGYLAELGEAGVRVLFDEGSECALTPGARGRLRVDASTGVRLSLERGSALLRIVPTKEPRWHVESGPFLVTVKGTDFTVGWDPTSERFELFLRRGRVVVSGPVVGDDFVVRPGQKLSVSLPKGESVVTEERTPPLPVASAAVPSAEAPPAPLAPSTPPPARLVPPRQWRSALAAGEWDRILTEAERAGVDAILETASSEDLFALADAARYRRRVDLAQAALLAHRRRFPSSARGTEAVFLLGRVAELRAAGRSVALQRYDEYLSRAPSGTYAAEALGRKMTLVNEVGRAGEARAIAQEYLKRFPDGSYAGAARKLASIDE